MEQLLLRHRFALGDTVLFTALCRDIQRAYPNRFRILLDTHFREVFDGNPHARALRPGETPGAIRRIDVRYGDGIRVAGRGTKVHMLSWYHRDFERKSKLIVPVTEPCGDLHLPPNVPPLVTGRYWLLVAGGKEDITCKWWWPDRYQAVVDRLRERGIACVQAGARHKGHYHPKLTGVVDMVGQTTSSQQLFALVRHADGVICPVTAAMHIAACFDRPCVVLSGGREEPWWEGYINQTPSTFGPHCRPVRVEHRFLHVMGQLPCCPNRGCWKHRTVPLNNGDRFDDLKRRCKLPISRDGFAVPRCMDMLTADQVVEAVLSYGAPQASAAAVAPARRQTMILVPGLGDSPVPAPARPLEAALPSPPLPAALSIKPAAQKTSFKPAALAHPTLGGRLTVCVLCYGPHPELARRCLGSIRETLPAESMDLRVGCNAVVPETLDYLKTLPITKLYNHPENAKKYPVMREMLHDASCPITTKYLVWFDDDTKIVDPRMWAALCTTIVANHPQGVRLYGWPMTHDTGIYRKHGHDPVAWFRAASWWRGRYLRTRGHPVEAPNGTVIQFVPGWHWAIAVETVRTADIPDRRLNHNGGDCTIGEQVHQAGGKIKAVNVDKRMVWTPARDAGGRRGYQEPFPWSYPTVQARGGSDRPPI